MLENNNGEDVSQETPRLADDAALLGLAGWEKATSLSAALFVLAKVPDFNTTIT
jgi:hypothetical protein